jgi:hypothetical protein
MRVLSILLLVCALLVACESEGAPGEDDTSGPEAVVAAMSEEGIECEGLSTTDRFANAEDATVIERGLCRVDDATVVISTFEDAARRDEWVRLNDLAGKVAVAENWVVGSDSQNMVQDIATALDASVPSAD